MEPRSKHFTSRLQEFPQIVTSCNSCFVSPWDEASLNHIAEKVFARSDILREGGKYAGYLDKIISSSVSIHLDMQAAGEAYRRVQSGYEVGACR